MNETEAIKIIEKTFDSKYDEKQFALFIKNLLNDIEVRNNSYHGNYIWDDYKEHVHSYKRIGKYIDSKNEAVDILLVEVKTVAKLERARSTLRNFVIKHLSKFDKDYALVAFYSKEDDGADWRFSFIKLEYQTYQDKETKKIKTQKEFTPAKRYSFLVGENERSYTAKAQLLPLLQNTSQNPTVDDIENAFSIEKVTNEFFEQYKDLYMMLYEHFEKDDSIQAELQKANITSVRFTKKLLGQIVFLYFLQKKGWLGVPKNEKWGKGQKRFVQNLFDEAQSKNKNYFKDYLQPLFYEALAKERENENSYYEQLGCRIPFLNGGLFEAEYDWQKANIAIPENLFRNKEKTKAKDTGTGILDVFDRYNFTIKEDEPLDKEVAIDPEMLGKVFENMLEITERKSKGAFYTPREIVHYMCQESLIHYLDNALENKIKKLDIETYIRQGHFVLDNDKQVTAKGKETESYKYQIAKDIRNNADLIDEKLSEIKICDPAIGSGAFPVGLLHELVNAQLVLKPYLSDKYRDKKLKNLGFQENEDKSESRYIYGLKRHIIQKSIYGVDIDASAIDIARLRFWLSLVVEEDDPEHIETLPNLDYKIVVGNSLVSKFEDEIIEIDWDTYTASGGIFGAEAIEKKTKLLEEISEKQKIFFTASSKDKAQLSKEIRTLKLDILTQQLELMIELSEISRAKEKNKKIRKEYDSKIESSKRALNLIKKLKAEDKPFQHFDWKLDFPEILNPLVSETSGFDIVIGNPPYVQLQKNEGLLSEMYIKSGYQTFEKMGDIYSLFYEKGIDMLVPEKGVLSFITSNKWMRAAYGKSLRNFFVQKTNPLQLIDFAGTKVFENATVDVNILLLQKNKYTNGTNTCIVSSYKNSLSEYVKENNNVMYFKENDSWVILSPIEQRIKEKIEKVGTPLKEWDIQINRGILTGYNDAFIITGEKRQELLDNCKDEEERKRTDELIRPILRGKDIKRYSYSFADKWLISTFPSKQLNIDEYPSVKKFLLGFKPKLEQTGKLLTSQQTKAILEHGKKEELKLKESDLKTARKKTPNQWFETQDQISYWEDFSKQKIIFQEIQKKSSFYLDNENNFYSLDTGRIITGKHLEYLLTILNSNIFFYAVKNYYGGGLLGEQGIRMKHTFFEDFPCIIPASIENKNYISLTKKLLNNPDDFSLIKKANMEIYNLYKLTDEEIDYIENAVK